MEEKQQKKGKTSLDVDAMVSLREKYIHRFKEVRDNHKKALTEDHPKSSCASSHRGAISVLNFVIEYIEENAN